MIWYNTDRFDWELGFLQNPNWMHIWSTSFGHLFAESQCLNYANSPALGPYNIPPQSKVWVTAADNLKKSFGEAPWLKISKNECSDDSVSKDISIKGDKYDLSLLLQILI